MAFSVVQTTWVDASFNPIISTSTYELVGFFTYVETGVPETGATATILSSPDGFTPTAWIHPPYTLVPEVFAPEPITVAPQTLTFGNTALPQAGFDDGVFLLVFGRFTTPGSKSFSVRFQTDQSAAVTVAANLTVSSVEPRTVTVDLYEPSNPPVLIEADIPVRDGGYWTEEDSDAGAAEVSLPESASMSVLAVEGKLLRFKVNGTPDRTAVIERIRVVPRAVNSSERIRTLTGRDWIMEFEDALVDPPLIHEWVVSNSTTGAWSRTGAGTPINDLQPQPRSIRFDWTHPHLPRPTVGGAGVQWQRPYNMGGMYKGNKDAIGNIVYPWNVGKLGQAPRGWPDSFTGWMWERPYGGPQSNHPVMTAWFHCPLYFDPNPPTTPVMTLGLDRAKANRPFIMVFTADDVGELAFDGTVVDSGATPPAIQWQRCSSVVIPNVTEGWHTITIKATNRPYYAGAFNIGAVALAAFQPVRDITIGGFDPVLQSAFDPSSNLILRTARNIDSPLVQDPTVNQSLAGGTPAVAGDLKRGGGWYCIGGEHLNSDPDAGFVPGFQPPAFTVGMAFRLLFEAAQGSNNLPGWTLTFTDVNDSAGRPWPKSDELTADVSETLLSVIRRWHDEGHWDVAARAGGGANERKLDAWVWQERGNYYLNGTALTWADEELANITIEGER
jgi:hypothetical protein